MKQRCSQKLSKEVCGRINCTLLFDDLQKVGSLTEHILHHETHMSVVCTLHTQQTCEIMSGTDLFVRLYGDHVSYQHVITKKKLIITTTVLKSCCSDTKPDANGLSCDCSSLMDNNHTSTCIFSCGYPLIAVHLLLFFDIRQILVSVMTPQSNAHAECSSLSCPHTIAFGNYCHNA
jgi:hypothetical protein